MTTSQLPQTISEYFRRIDNDAKETAVDLFTADAQVTDDGTTYQGRTQILGWLTGQASEFTTTSTQLSVEVSEPTVVVVVRVEGNFPGGRVDLRNSFTLDPTGLLSGLTIAAQP